MLFHNTSLVYLLCLRLLTPISVIGLRCFIDKVQGVQSLLAMFLYLSISKKSPIPSGESGGSLMGLRSHAGIFPPGLKIW